MQLTKRFCWGKQTDTETMEDHWEQLFESEQECGFPKKAPKYFYQYL